MTSAIEQHYHARTRHEGEFGNLVYPLDQVRVDLQGLRADYDRVSAAHPDWTPQDRKKVGKTNWTGISLYSLNGRADDMRCSSYPITKPTPAAEYCPHIMNELLPQLGIGSLLRVAFYRVDAGTGVGRHRDWEMGRANGVVRIHVPIVTNEQAIMFNNGRWYHMPAGQAWYFDTSSIHAVENGGDEHRIHLAVDVRVGKETSHLFKRVQASDRIRFVYVRGRTFWKRVRAFASLVWSDDGRRRIAESLRVRARALRAKLGPG